MQISLMCRLDQNNKLNKKFKQLTELVDNGLLELDKPSTKQIPSESLPVKDRLRLTYSVPEIETTN